MITSKPDETPRKTSVKAVLAACGDRACPFLARDAGQHRPPGLARSRKFCCGPIQAAGANPLERSDMSAIAPSLPGSCPDIRAAVRASLKAFPAAARPTSRLGGRRVWRR